MTDDTYNDEVLKGDEDVKIVEVYTNDGRYLPL